MTSKLELTRRVAGSAGQPIELTELTVNARLLGAVVVISVLAAVLFSLAPILQMFRCDLAGLMITGGRGIAGGRQRLPRILV